MGGIKIISPMPKPLSTKAFPKMTGGMERNETQRANTKSHLMIARNHPTRSSKTSSYPVGSGAVGAG